MQTEAIRRYSSDFGMSTDRLEAHFWNWRRWMRTGGLEELGLPSRVPVIGIRHSTDIDDEYEDMDRMTARATDAAIESLKRLEHDAIYCEYMGMEWTHAANIHVVLVVARQAVRLGLIRRGIA